MSSIGATHPTELREISGPSAFGGGTRRFFELVWLTAVTEFRLGYHGTVLGFLWSLARPLMRFGVLLVVFTQIFQFGDEIEHYPAMLLFNVMLFTFFAEATENAVTSVVRNENVVRKMQFPRLVIPLAVVLTSILQLSLNLVVVFVIIVATGVDPIWTWIMLPVLLGYLLVLTTAASMLLSALYVRIRDVAILWSVLAMVLFYASPVLYPIDPALDLPPAEFRDVILLNPLTPLFEQVREWIIDPNAPGAIEGAEGNPLLILVPGVLFCSICALGLWVFNREAPRIAEDL
ncbi:MAG: ABC transporter permease [Solirubrobacterales bacterium]